MMSTRRGYEIEILQGYNNDESELYKIREPIEKRIRQAREKEERKMEINRINKEFITLFNDGATNGINTIYDILKDLKDRIENANDYTDFKPYQALVLKNKRKRYIQYCNDWIHELRQNHEISSHPDKFIYVINSYWNETY